MRAISQLCYLIAIYSILLTSVTGKHEDIFASIFRIQLLNKVDEFTAYHLYYRTHYQQTYSNPHILSKCSPDILHNQTELMFLRYIDRCPNESYLPRQLTNDDVEWHPTSKNSSNNPASPPNNLTSNTTNRSKSSKTEIVHRYLAVALLLPSHPFSSELLDSLLTVAPMFPMVTIATTNAHKYRCFTVNLLHYPIRTKIETFCRKFSNQYNVKFFPRLILFKEGIYQQEYEASYKPEKLAEAFAKFTESLPRSYPVRSLAHTRISGRTMKPESYLDTYEKKASRNDTQVSFIEYALYLAHKVVNRVIVDLSSIKGLEKLIRLKYQSSVEPLAGTLGSLIEHDILILGAGVMYVLIRWIQLAVKFFLSVRRDDA